MGGGGGRVCSGFKVFKIKSFKNAMPVNYILAGYLFVTFDLKTYKHGTFPSKPQ